jgi:toxin ParE1/3/4
MSGRLVKKMAAQQDLVDHFAFIGKDSLDAASRLLIAAEKAFELLLEMPGLGRTWEVRNPRLAGLRMWPIRGFDKYLIFYRPIEDGIEIVRVLHGAQDIQSILGE